MAKVIKEPTTGKLGLTVFFPGRTGLIQRSWVVPANPRTGDQLLVRSNLTSVAKGWGLLTEAQRLAWIAAAEQYSTNPSLGQSGRLTGSQLYTKINAALLAIGGTVVTAPPVAPTFTPLPIDALEITNEAGVIALKLHTTASPPDGTMLRAGRPQSPGTYRPANLRLLGTLGSPVASYITFTSQDTVKSGVPAVGQKIFVSCNANIDGWEGPPVVLSAIVPASS